MLLKALIVCLLIFIIFNLFRALPVMLKGKQAYPMSRYLGRRILLSVILFALLLLALASGVITPNPRPY
ncbi:MULTISPECIES: DUF2909 domain-containing protein [Photobacterium]|uniref:DUF2909 domain-containing protein n=1 Tax=Photobacterium ganghwense TaxID=320778 RepID=A0A0J1H1R6_9GAMM|nr:MULTISPECIES: DUF2909 domain-containing protein [Photobacterium]KLV05735.1 hypothetical protein ABT57_21190 [Photobacterium ganghwense]MBV1841203.1 DUF2909 domain-containing protein [Photobacterium ganghwense]PSU06271.1 DUF2909 domain-containing protein [Photobacterium ganghwense]QSV14203.1 DUF2909 domain-containing protein [Photobacterium ganghwense]